jgi:hypothetical protein
VKGGSVVGLSKKMRFEVFKRDSFKCQYCGKSAPDVVLEVDHIVPKSKGGTDDILNLITSCFDCNRGKTDKTLDDETVLKKQMTQMEELNEKRIQIEMLAEWYKELRELDEKQVDLIEDVWKQITNTEFNLSQRDEIKKLVKRYGFEMVLECVPIALDKYLRKEKNGTPIETSFQDAFEGIKRIIIGKRRFEKNPWLMELYYVRGILRNRLTGYMNEKQAIILLTNAYKKGATTEDLKQLALNVCNWSEFKWSIEGFISGKSLFAIVGDRIG